MSNTRIAPAFFLLTYLVIGVGMLVVGSYIAIPVEPVPFTLQTYALLLIIFLMPPRISIMVVALYLLLGILGLPVFSPGKSGWKTIAGVTGGYLWGFLTLTILFAYLKRPFLRLWRLLYLAVLGHGIILLCGVLQFTVQRNLLLALSKGFYPFIVPALLKSFLVALTVWLVRRLSPSTILARRSRD